MCWPVPWCCRALSIPRGVWTGRRCAGTSGSGTCGSWYGGSCWRWLRSATGGGRHTAAPVAVDEVFLHARPTSQGWLLAILLVGPFMSQADATIVNVAMPSIRAGLGTSGAALELVVGGYLIAFAVLLITGARLGQAFGYRRVFLSAVAAFGLASLACGLAPGPVMLVVARVVQGASAALMFPQALTGIQLNFNGPDRVRAIGLYAAALSC